MHRSNQTEIDRPIDEVFRVISEEMKEWSLVVVDEESLDGETGPEGPQVGSRFRTLTEENGKTMVFEGVVTKYDPPTVQAAQLTGDLFDIESEFRLHSLGDRTGVTHESKVHGKGWFRVFLMLFGWLFSRMNCKAGEDELASLKRYCESQPA